MAPSPEDQPPRIASTSPSSFGFLRILANSGLTLNRIWFARLVTRFPLLSRLLRLRLSPEVLIRLENLAPVTANGTFYASVVSRLRVGTFTKAVGAGRNRLTDNCVIRLVRENNLKRICDIGASDGAASVRLLKDLPNTDIHLFDKYVDFLIRPRALGCEIRNSDGELVYRRFGPFLFFRHQRNSEQKSTKDAVRVPCRNPLLRPFNAWVRPLDFFQELPEGTYQLAKCCNLLNTDYFSNEDLLLAIKRLSQLLDDNGFLVIGQNHASYLETEAYLVLRRRGQGWVLVEEKNSHPLVSMLNLKQGQTILKF